MKANKKHGPVETQGSPFERKQRARVIEVRARESRFVSAVSARAAQLAENKKPAVEENESGKGEEKRKLRREKKIKETLASYSPTKRQRQRRTLAQSSESSQSYARPRTLMHARH